MSSAFLAVRLASAEPALEAARSIDDDLLTALGMPAMPNLFFEQNVGQAVHPVEYLCRGLDCTLYFTPKEAIISMRHPASVRGEAVLRMRWANGWEKTILAGENPLDVAENILAASQKVRFRSIPQFRRVHYTDIYPGVDLVFYGNRGEVEYDIIVKPGGEPSDIALRFEGADRVELNDNGDLVLLLNGREVVQSSPVIFQQTKEGPVYISGSYLLYENDEVGFTVAQYDKSLPLVIDPILTWVPGTQRGVVTHE